MTNQVSIEGFRLSPQQAERWPLYQESVVYTARCEISIEGILDVQRLESAIQSVIARHEILRTSYQSLESVKLPVQVISDDFAFSLSQTDLTSLTDQEQTRQLDQSFRTTGNIDFDWTQSSLLRAELFRLSQARHVLQLSLPAIGADAITLQNLFSEIATAFNRDGSAVSPVEEPTQFVQVSEWLNQILEEEEKSDRDNVDLRQLASLTLPGQSTAVDSVAFAPAVLEFQVAPLVIEQVDELAARHQCSPNAALLAAWQILLARLTDKVDFAVGLVCDGRRYDELTGALGLFAKTVPLICHCEPGLTFVELLDQTLNEMSRVRIAPEYFVWPASQDQELTGPAFFSVVYEDLEEVAPQQSGDVILSLLKVTATTEPFKLKLVCRRRQKALSIELHYDRSLFGPEAINQLNNYFQTLLSSVPNGEQTSISDLNLLDDELRHLLLVSFNDTSAPYPQDKCLHDLIAEQVARTPDELAVVSDRESITFAELDRRANQLAHHLVNLGVGPESRVGICLDRSLELIVSLVAVLKAGGAYVALSPTDPQERLAFMLADAKVLVLLTRANLITGWPEMSATVVDLETEASQISRQQTDKPLTGVTPQNLAYVLYTSGSTGTPKGTLITHRSLVNYLSWCSAAYEVADGEGAPVHTSIAFDLTVTSILSPLLKGRKILLLSEERGLDALAEAMLAHRNLSFVKLTPAHLEILNQQLSETELADRTQALIIGGEALLAETIAPWRRHAPHTRLINEYGPTETVVGCCVYEVAGEDPATGSVPIGRPVANTQLYVVDKRNDLAPLGVIGELFIGGDGLARGYHDRPDLTAEKFVPNPFSSEEGERLYRTGDLARRRSDGVIEFLGRKDDQVKVRGYRIELGEIEAALRSHESVQEAVVVAQADGPGENRLIAFVIADPQVFSAADLRNFLQAKLPDYMVPPVLVRLDHLPLAPSGKVDRRGLSLGNTEMESQVAFVSPRTLTEEVLAVIWAEVLHAERVGIDDNFFALGGDSIRSIQVRARAQQRGINLAPQQLFQYPTIRELARVAQFDDAGVEELVSHEPFSLISEADYLKLPADIEDAYPLSLLQAGMLFHSELNPESAIFHDLHSFHLQVPFERNKLEQVLARLAQTHTTLRTSFDLKNFSQPLQMVHANVTVPLEEQDIRHLESSEQESAVAAALEDEKQRKFDWERAPLLRFRILRRSDETCQFVLSFHHSILDGWSVATMLTDLFNRYAALLAEQETPELAPPTTAYRDYVAMELAALNSEDNQQYWSNLLADASFRRIPRWKLDSTGDTPGNVYQVVISEDLSRDLSRLARINSVPVKSVLLAAHLKVMSLLGGSTDVLTALISNGRPEESDGDRMLGLFLNTLPFRLNLGGGSWSDLIKETFAAERKQLPYRRYPLAELQRKQGGQPLFETAFNYMHYHVYQNMTQASNVRLLDYLAFEETNFPLMANFAMEPVTSLIQLHLNYHPGELSHAQIKTIGDYYLRSLESLASEPEQHYENVCLLTAAEQRQILDEWNRTATGYPRESCLPQLIEAQTAGTPGAVAISDRNGALTYDQLNQRANRLARLLIEQGVGPETVVPLLMNRQMDFVTAMLALFKTGAAYLPLDPLHPPHRLAQIISRSGTGPILTTADFLPILGEAVAGFTDGERKLFTIEDLLTRERSGENLEPHSDPANLAYVIFTSGSTGVPKGVMIEHQGMLNHLFAKVVDLKIAPDDVVAQTASQCFDISVWQFLSPLLVGGRVSIFDEETTLDPALLLARVHQEGVTILEVVPSMLRAILDEVQHGSTDPKSLASLRFLLTTGEALPPELARQWFNAYPQIPIVNAYGPTECSDDVTHHFISKAPADDVTRMPIGRPIANTQLYVLDSGLRPVPPFVAGELYVAGEGVGRGYLHDPEQTAATFIPDLFAGTGGGRLYRTGDLAQYQMDGTIEFLGRRDQQVKVRGFRIELNEIEAVLSSHSLIRDAVVITGEEGTEKRLIAYLVYGAGDGPSIQELREYVRERLPEYMMPSVFAVLNELPLTATGKVDRKALPSASSAVAESFEQSYVAPETPAEVAVATIWAEVLRVERVGKTDNFFELGGHSLLATQVISRLRSEFRVEVPLRRIFEAPTVAALAAKIEEARAEQQSYPGEALQTIPKRDRRSIKPRQSKTIDELLVELDGPSFAGFETTSEEIAESHPLSFSQEKIWADVKANNSFNMPLAMRLSGELQVPVLEQSFREIIKRHEALRSMFGEEQGRAVQYVSETLTLDMLPVADLEMFPDDSREAEVQRIIAAESRREFDLSTGPQLRVTLLKLGDREHVALATMPLIISDAWSSGVLIGEIGAFYAALSQGRPSPLPELPIQLADYAHWERQLLNDEALDREFEYWGDRLNGELPILNLSTDRPRAEQLSFKGASESLILEAELVDKLRALGRQEGVTMFMLMLAAFNTFLARYTDQDDIIVGIPAAGRNWVETEPLIGSFANTLIIRTDLSGRPGFLDLLKRVRDVTLGAYAHQQMPFLKLLEFLRSRGMKEKLPYRVMFDLGVAGNGNASPVANLPGLQVSVVEEEASSGELFVGNYLTFVLQEIGPELIAFLRYKTELFDAETIAGMLDQFRAMLLEIVASPDKEITQLLLGIVVNRESSIVNG
ncbi:MAG TPA: amino acid adenylation domain-containing protein [Pyrinomonadaceae bacterium]